MSSAQGFIKSSQPGTFIATFNIDGNLYLFSGNVNPSTPPFESNSATLQYDSVQSLEGSQQITGIIGSRDEVSFTFEDGTSIKGPLNIPVSPASRVEVLPSIFLQTSAMSSKPLLPPSRLEILTMEKEMIDA
ncbi:hypothetical protein FGLOB1_10051 [Fusarium globosum]|uniref:Uncharacterized protein n=1 Tax=Fusarium globosum TaxID=78864 RepID=A0A8H5XWR2_9HYPO|nr:hypothetical protein FGLOB1_10051 [Fusarium globosum]